MRPVELPIVLPSQMLRWFPLLWSRILFPGETNPSEKIRPWSLFILLLLPGLLLYPSRSFRLLEPDEGRYAQIPKEMNQSGSWIVPLLQDEPYLDKPPLFYYLVMIAYRIFGTADSVARLVPALSVHATILLVYLLGRRSLGERAAFWGGILLTASPGFMGMGRLILLDGLLTFLVTLALLSLFESIRTSVWQSGWWYLSALACGFGILTKGPIALILLGIPFLGYRWLSGNRVSIPKLGYLGFAMVMLLVNLPWYLGIYLSEPVFLRYFFWEHNVLRFLQPFDHLQPVWFYVPILLGGLMPATLLLPSFFRGLFVGTNEENQKRTSSLGFFFLSAGWCVLFFSISGSKLPTYVLPAFPPLMLSLGSYLVQSRWDRSILSKSALTLTVGLLGVAFYIIIPTYASHRSPMRHEKIIQEYCQDPQIPIICFPRHCDSVAFYLDRHDLKSVRSKYTQKLVEQLLENPKTIVLLTHRESLPALEWLLPGSLKLTKKISFQIPKSERTWFDNLIGDTPWGLCDLAVVERVQ